MEADIRGFFDHINHDWLIKMLEERIADRSLIRIIRKWLKAGVIEELKHWSPSYEGTPQGGIISPLLGNIYLHFVQDLWIKKVMAKKSKGSVIFRRYADDSIVCFERKDDAEIYLRELPKRLAKFGLELAEEKSALVKFNRWEPESSGRFTFLGFDFHWARSLVYKWLNRRSQRKSFSVTSFTEAWERWKMPSPRVIEKPWSKTDRQSQSPHARNVQPIRIQS